MSEGRERYRTNQPSLGEVLAEQEGDVAVITIKEVKDQTFTDANKKSRVAMVILSEEYPDNPYFPSAGRNGAIDRLFDKLGDDQTAWVGEKIPLTRVHGVYNPSTQTTSDKFHVAALDEWDEILKEHEASLKSRRQPPKSGGRK